MTPETIQAALSSAHTKGDWCPILPSVGTWCMPHYIKPKVSEDPAGADPEPQPALSAQSSGAASAKEACKEEIRVRWMASGDLACAVRASKLVAEVKAQIQEASGVPVEEQCLYVPGDGALSLGDAVDLPSDVEALLLVRCAIDPRITDLGHFRCKWEVSQFDALPRGSFTRVRALGEGVNGSVYHYSWRRDRSELQVAVKRLPIEKLSRIPFTETNERAVHLRQASDQFPTEQEDALTEIGILSHLSKQGDLSLHLLRMQGVFSDGTYVWLATELAEGGELFQAVSSGRIAGEVPARRYTGDMLDAVTYLHRHHVGHRDISLENALLTADGTLKIMDFGMAVRSHSSSGVAFRYFRSVGKDGYRAPECYVPSVEEVSDVVWPAGALPGDVRMMRLSGSFGGWLSEVRLPVDAEPGRPCKAEVWGYRVQPADIFSVGVCFFIMCYQCPFFRKATLADSHFSWVVGQGACGLTRLVQSWGKEPLASQAQKLLEAMVQLDPSKRPVASECLAHPCFASDFEVA